MTRQEFEKRLHGVMELVVSHKGTYEDDVRALVLALRDAVAPLLDDTRAREHKPAEAPPTVTYTRTVTVGDEIAPPSNPYWRTDSTLDPQVARDIAEMANRPLPAGTVTVVSMGDGAPAKTRGQEVAEKLFFDRHDSGLLPAAWVMAIAKAIDAELTANNAAWSRALHLPPNIAWTPEAGGKHVAGQMEGVGTMARADGVKDHARAMTDAHEAGKDIGEREGFERIMAILSKHRRAEAEKYEKANTAPVNAAMRRDAANRLSALVWAMKEIDPSIE